MFEIAGSDAQTYWLTVTNIVLGIFTFACVLVVAAGVVKELLLRRRDRNSPMSGIDQELAEMLAEMEEGHACSVPGPGPSSAEGWGNPRGKKDKPSCP